MAPLDPGRDGHARGAFLVEHEMNYANLNVLLNVLLLVVPLAVAPGAAMLGSYLVFTLPAWIRRRAHRRAVEHAALPEASLATVIPLRAYGRDLCEPWAGVYELNIDRRTA
jgi:hypothetical protein